MPICDVSMFSCDILVIFQCCISDIDNAIQCGYPKHLVHKLYVRKGQCYYHLHEYDESLKGNYIRTD